MFIEYYPQPIEDTVYDTCEVCDMYKKEKDLHVLFGNGKIEDEVVCICKKCLELTDLAAFEWVTYNQEIINQFIKLKQ
jgi:hypothetical protein